MTRRRLKPGLMFSNVENDAIDYIITVPDNIPYRTKFSSDKIFRRTKFSTPSRNFDNFVQFLADFCIEILDKIFDGQSYSSKKNFRHQVEILTILSDEILSNKVIRREN